jgi:hypothetical protein
MSIPNITEIYGLYRLVQGNLLSQTYPNCPLSAASLICDQTEVFEEFGRKKPLE